MECDLHRYNTVSGQDCWSRLAVQLDLEVCVAKEGRVFVHEARGGHAAVFSVELDANAVPVGFEGSDHAGAGAAERVEDAIADEQEHLDDARGKFVKGS